MDVSGASGVVLLGVLFVVALIVIVAFLAFRRR
jgi:hypothetical protein